ncbi:ATP-binding protein [Streptomyces galbus]
MGTALLIAAAGLVFLHRMTAGLDASLGSALRAQADAEVVRLAAGRPFPPLPPPSARDPDGGLGTGAGAERVAQVLAPDGRLLAFTDGAGARPLADAAETRAATRKDVPFTASVQDQDYRMLAVPATHEDRRVVVVVGASTRIADAATAHTRDALLLGGPAAVLAAGLAAYWLAGSALRPVDRMRRRLGEIAEQGTGGRLETPATHDEIATLAATMNDVLDRLSDALAQQRGFAADAGHELRTPLTTLKAELELAGQPGRSREELVAAVSAAARDTDRLIRLSEDLLLLSGIDEGRLVVRPQLLAPASLLGEAVRSVASTAAERRVRVRLRSDDGVRVVADPDRLRQAVDNLLDNALRYAYEGSEVEVALTVVGGAPGARCVIEVRDHGPGFPPPFRRWPSNGSAAPTPPGAGTPVARVWDCRSCAPSPGPTAATPPPTTRRAAVPAYAWNSPSPTFPASYEQRVRRRSPKMSAFTSPAHGRLTVRLARWAAQGPQSTSAR